MFFLVRDESYTNNRIYLNDYLKQNRLSDLVKPNHEVNTSNQKTVLHY